MKLADARGAYEALSGKASDIVRQISLAGVALIWLFRTSTSTGSQTILLDPRLLRAAVFIFCALLFDFLQYLLGTVFWFLYFRHKENQGTDEAAEFLAPPQLNWPAWGFFYIKSTLMVIAYAVYIIPFLFSRLGA